LLEKYINSPGNCEEANMVEYYDKWSWPEGRGINPIMADDAKNRHAGGQPYVAVFVENGIKRVISFIGSWVSIDIVDNIGRIYLQYNFKKSKEFGLFLTLARHTEFTNDDKQPFRMVTFSFKENGTLLIEDRNLETGDVREKESRYDIDSNKEPYPAFGIYSSIGRLER
jgi:hypothetical protein